MSKTIKPKNYILRPDQAVAHFNLKHKKAIDAGTKKMLTRTELAEYTFPHLNRERASEKLSRLSNNKEEKITLKQFQRYCEKAEVDGNFALSIPPM